MQLVLGFIYIAVTGAVLFSMAALLFRGENTPASRMYLVCQGMVVLWCSSQLLQMIARTRGELTAAFLIGNIGICFWEAPGLFFPCCIAAESRRGSGRCCP